MPCPDDSPPAADHSAEKFASTQWSQVLQAGLREDPATRPALTELYSRY
jgi:hypothetical protein